MKIIARAIGLVAVLLPAWAFAGTYFGVAGLKAERSDYSDVDASYGGKAYLGYRFASAPILLEASYIDTGDADVDAVDGASQGFKMNFSGYTLGAGYFLELTPQGSGFWLRGAWYSGDTKVKAPRGSIPGYPDESTTLKQSSDGGSLAVGGVWKLGDTVGLRLEYETLFGPKDFAEDQDIGLLSVGLLLEFGGAAPRPRPRPVDRGRVMPPMPYETPAPAAEPLSPPAPMPATASTTMPTQPLLLRPQPRLDAGVLVAIPVGATYQRLQQIHNDEGDWAFVQYEGRRGWLYESGGR